jgi:hypothetical protein
VRGTHSRNLAILKRRQCLRRGTFKGISGTLKQKAWVLGLRETIWKPFGVSEVFFKQELPFERESVLKAGEMMMILLLFLQKQNLAFAVYLLGSVLSLPD